MNRSCSQRWRQHTFVTIVLISLYITCGLTACTEQPPVKIGFIGGLSGRVADLGLAGRNGAILAVEEQNRAGGIDGKDVHLLVMDDKQDADVARKAVSSLLEQDVAAIVGPLTSTMAMATIPLANEQQVVMISPTSTSEELTGIDDFFFRAVASTSHYANHHAYHLYEELGVKTISIISDLSNKSFVESYCRDFCATYKKLGGKTYTQETFHSGTNVSFYDLVNKTIGPETEGILLIASAIDTAVLCQQIKKIRPEIKIATSEWSATEKLVELGGVAVEGVLFHQLFNRDSTDPAYLKFRKGYLERFGTDPGFASVVSYDSTKIALDAYQAREGRNLKEALIEISTFSGAQGQLTIDRFGDTDRPSYLSTIRDGKFVILETAHSHE